MKPQRMQVTNQLNWETIRNQFTLTKRYIHLGASQFIASHPRPVRQALSRYRRALDYNPVLYTQAHEDEYMQRAREAAARYLDIKDPDDIAMTDSTTMGLGTLYTGLNLQPGQEILTSLHDHYSHHEAIRLATLRTGASYRKVPLYRQIGLVTQEEIVESVRKEISDQTRVVGLTWVHSSTGLRLPIRQIADVIQQVNQQREADNQILYIVDGVHGFGIELETFPQLGCDFFVAGCHKWLYGPRGTGLIAAKTSAWQVVNPVIPGFTEAMDAYSEGEELPDMMGGRQMTPGGFHSLEHRWALTAAFDFMNSIGKERVHDRVHELAHQCKQALAQMKHVILHTPLDSELSSGIVAFEVRGLSSDEVVEQLLKQQIIATVAPYQSAYVRFTPGIINTPAEVDKAVAAIAAMEGK
ncbi:MAG TPA: aminotransferase class V-fold PLP-dependent enzyme [Fibrella sp.]